ncbi:hypothetical protein H4R34_000729 [Dimargaris verticillata]|uniref:FAD/NAD(P)-binding domain-containing protein n=1 Tax=Dimargaris verticillata TaxID=2761393 RepID=A0A9W8BB93_9FUNG|nr:hypothetical protein H4R34_000729 [Dimargaris verticillata]
MKFTTVAFALVALASSAVSFPLDSIIGNVLCVNSHAEGINALTKSHSSCSKILVDNEATSSSTLPSTGANARAMDGGFRQGLMLRSLRYPRLLASALGRPLGSSGLRQARLAHSKRPRVVVLGSGWAGFELLRRLDKRQYDVTLVSPRNYFVFTPLLASTSVGTLEFRCIVEPVRSKSSDIKYYEATCDNVDVDQQTIQCTSGLDNNRQSFTLPYDQLIVTVGAQTNTFNTPGVTEHALFLKDIKDARNIRQRVIDCFEKASQPFATDQQQRQLLHFAVVGGGPTGVEFSAELNDFIRDDLSRIYPHLMDKVRMTVYDVAPTILGSFDVNLAKYAVKRFQRQGIKIRTNTQITEVTKDHLMIRNQPEEPYGLLVWSTGLTDVPLSQSLAKTVANDAHGKRLLTDFHLRLLRSDGTMAINNVFALGDCADITGYSLPATAQVARQKARYLAQVLNRVGRVQGWTLNDEKQFTYQHLGSMAYLGGWKAIVDLGADGDPKAGTVPEEVNAVTNPFSSAAAKRRPLRLTDYIGEGRLAWLFWRSAYFTMSVSLKNKILIPVYWFLTWLLGRDISRF